MAKQKVSAMDYNVHKPKGKPEAVKVSGASIVEAINANPVYQPIDSDLTAIAALSTTTFGRSLLESANAAALRTLISAQPLDSDLTAIAGLTSAANKLPYFTGSGTAALADLSASGRALIDDESAAAQLTTLGVTAAAQTVLDDATVGAMLTTLGGQPLDTELTALAGLTSAADKVPYFTGSGTAAVTDLTATGRSIIDDTSVANVRTTLGLGAVALLETVATANINNDSVTFAKMQNSTAASRLLGRGSAAGAGDFEEITISTGLTLTGTVLTAGGGSYGSVAAWCVFNGTGTIALVQNSSNVSSLTDNGTGDYTVNFSPSLTDANYAMAGSGSGGSYKDFISLAAASEGAAATTKTSAACRIICGRSEGTNTDGVVISAIFVR